MKNEKALINDKNLESVTGGTAAPELPATKLEDGEYSGMFPNLQGLEQKEIHIYKDKIADRDSFIIKTD